MGLKCWKLPHSNLPVDLDSESGLRSEGPRPGECFNNGCNGWKIITDELKALKCFEQWKVTPVCVYELVCETPGWVPEG